MSGSFIHFARVPLCLLTAAALIAAWTPDSARADTQQTSVCLSIYPGANYGTGSIPAAIATGDFDLNGIRDLALATSNGISVLLGGGSAGTGDGTFGAPTTYAAGMPASFIATGDFNDDGRLDVVASFDTGVGLLLGQPGGTLASPVIFSAGGGRPSGLATGDFDQNGILDVAAAIPDSGDLAVLLGAGAEGVGTGQFVSALACSVGGGPTRIVTFRQRNPPFVGDHDMDLVVLRQADNQVSLLSGGSGGAFTVTGTYAVGLDPRGLAIGDFNEDGRADLAVSNAGGNNISVLIASGTVFQAAVNYPAAGTPRDVVTGDFNGDGITDLATTLYNSGRVALLAGGGSGGQGNGTFDFPSLYVVAAQPGPLVAGEFLEDGAPDVVAGSTSAATVSTLLNGCLPGTPVNLTLSLNAQAGAVPPDHPFLIGTQLYANWTRGTGVVAVQLEISYDGGSSWEAIGPVEFANDFEWTMLPPAGPQAILRVRDAIVPDRAAVIGPHGACRLLGTPIASAATPGVERGVSADFNGDGIADLALTTTGAVIAVLLGQGTSGVGNGSFSPADTIGTGHASGIATGDFDDDGILDLALSLGAGPGILFGQGTGGVGNGDFGPAQIISGIAGVALATGDFNEDGILDLAAGNGTAGRVSIYLGLGTWGIGSGTFAAPVEHPMGGSPLDIHTGDFNEDGILDIVAARFGAGSILFGQGAEGNGNGTFAAPTSLSETNSIVTPGDFAHDGITDLAVGFTFAGGGFGLKRGLGSAGVGDGTFGSMEFISLAYGLPASLVVGDIDTDGILDLVASTPPFTTLGDGSASIGDGTFSPVWMFFSEAPSRLLVGDFVEDGFHDVLALVPSTGTVSVLPAGCQLNPPGSVTVTSPNGGEGMLPGSESVLAWSKSAVVGPVDLEVSRDNGVHWERIASRIEETSFTWTVSQPFATQARLRVMKSGANSIADVSDAPFLIGETTDAPLPGPTVASLSVPQPNPFAGRVSMTLVVPSRMRASATIYDLRGRRVRELVSGELEAGAHPLTWDGRDEAGARQPPGVYFVGAQWSGSRTVRRLVLLR